MTRLIAILAAGSALTLAGPAAQAADGPAEINVAYFLEWPLPMLAAKADGGFEKALGAKVNWVSFETGTAMSAALASGDVQLAVSQGLPPFVVAASAGQPIQVIDIAVSYSENDNCVVSNNLEIDKTNAGELAGKRVAVPVGTAAHYGFLRQMQHFGVDPSAMAVVDMAPPEGAAALAQGAVDMACGYGGGLTRMKEHGHVLLTGKEKEDLGILVFDVVSTPSQFAAEYPDLLAAFIKVTEEENAKWRSGEGGDAMLEVLAKEAGMDLEPARAAISTMEFPTLDEKLSEKWLGGGVQTFMKGVADTFAAAGSIGAAMDSYDGAVNAEPMRIANGAQ
ncbi:taurine transport system substrate-binding protein [Paracoccus aminovorans]|uniref:Taurine transport system substrate-binding protein n=1 Tax=Paracoccus aminovorans TaxID=34004 RepID=A0A1I3DG53_9RHOB|nr:ABC transporter substrate-binding protein [Paracoccus aminovorans]CQR84070.1 taurine ABC transporter, periplasmic taurine-binding protein [Paracoccus aminovorans]SFH85740.1 taurine transport system substrate-binding protein [Paracoccus aminovorans]